MVVYPEECEEEEEQQIINPTICLASTIGQARGMLIYEGMGDYPDFELREGNDILGKNPKSSLYINRETVSQFHAKFEYADKKYYIEDLNSTNGTYIMEDGTWKPVKGTVEISAGDQFMIANTVFTLQECNIKN